MIDIVDHIIKILAPMNTMTFFQAIPTGIKTPDEYITFLEINANPEFEAGDIEIKTRRLIQVNIWSKENYYSLVEQTKSLLESAGYERTFEYDAPYSDGDSHFNKVLRFKYLDEY